MYYRFGRTINLKFVAVLILLCIIIRFFFFRLPSCNHRSSDTSISSARIIKIRLQSLDQWRFPKWVQRYNVSHLFDWTWYKNNDFRRCRTSIIQHLESLPCKATSAIVVNDVVEYFRTHPNEGCIVDNVARLPNLIPHPLPHARSLKDTCSSLHIDHEWILCNKLQSELDNWLPSTKRFITYAVFNAFIDIGHCHPAVPGIVFNDRATFHVQRWTKKKCANDVISYIPQMKSKYRYRELIDSIGNYLQEPGHFGPQQLPRLLRLLATVPTTAKVLVAKGGVADMLIDVLIDRGIVTRDRIVQFDKNMNEYYFANIVYRSDPWPYLKERNNVHYHHDRTDMQLVHRVIATDELSTKERKDRIILIKRNVGRARSIIEHSDIASYISLAVNKSKVASDLNIEIFEAQGHIRDHIKLFRRARIIIGAHGAGMMNILWSSPRTYVVEIGYTSGMTFPEMYAEMSLHLDQKYWICKGYGDYSSPIHVDMNDFMFIFNRILHEIELEKS